MVVGDREPEVGDFPCLRYAEWVIKESMRIYPPAWGVGRRALREFKVRDYSLPAGTNVLLMQWLTQHDPRFYPEPDGFNPDRWAGNAPDRELPRFAYFPFGGGPRMCVGASFAMVEATLLLAAITRQFRLTLVSNQHVEMLPSVTLRPKNGIRMVLKKRDWNNF